MANSIMDIGIIGAGIAGSFALQKLLKSNKGLKIGIFEVGRNFGKRRHQICGALGILPSSDGKLFLNNLTSVSEIAGHKKTLTANKWVIDQLSEITDLKLIKDKRPSLTAEKRLRKCGFDIELNNHYQLYPSEIHQLSKSIVTELDKNSNTLCSFDNEVLKVLKHKGYFSIITSEGNFQCKKVLISVGRGGWRCASELFAGFGIVENNDIAKYGIRVEMPATYMKDFNQSNCTLLHNSVEIGPFGNKGSVIPADYIDFAATEFRSNEDRWKTDKISFNIMASKYFPENGYQQVERLAKLSFILGNDRVTKEKLSTFMNGKSKLSVLPEYEFLLQELEELNEVIPELINKASFYFPCVSPMAPKIKLKSDFSTEIKDLYVAGESARVKGILGAMVSGAIVSDALCK